MKKQEPGVARFRDLLEQHRRQHYARHRPRRSEREWPALSPLEERRGWAEAVLRAASPNFDLSRVAPKKRARLTDQREALRLTAEAYLQAWREAELAFSSRQPVSELLAMVDLATAFVRSEQFACSSLSHPVDLTVWDCTRQGFEKLSAQSEWNAAQKAGNLEKGRAVQLAIEEARARLVDQNPELAGPGMQYELARRIERSPELQGEDGAPMVRAESIRKRLRKFSRAGTFK